MFFFPFFPTPLFFLSKQRSREQFGGERERKKERQYERERVAKIIIAIIDIERDKYAARRKRPVGGSVCVCRRGGGRGRATERGWQGSREKNIAPPPESQLPPLPQPNRFFSKAKKLQVRLCCLPPCILSTFLHSLCSPATGGLETALYALPREEGHLRARERLQKRERESGFLNAVAAACRQLGQQN